MCKIILAVALPLAVPFLEGGGRLSAQGDAVWQERFSKEAPQQWEKYRARASRLQGSWSFTVSRILDANEKQILTKRYQEHKQRKNCALYLEQSYTEGGKQAEDRSFLRVRNPRYGFQLTRSSPDGPWAISHVGTELWTRASFDSPAWWVEEITALPNKIASPGPTLQALVNEPAFKVRGATGILRDGREFGKVDFRYQPQGPESRTVVFRGGSITFDSDRYWVVHRYEVDTEWAGSADTIPKGTDTGTFEYEHSGDGFPILKRLVVVRKIPSLKNHTEFRYEFDLGEADVPESQFTLPAFGFPEPGDVQRPARWYLWLAVAGVACLLLVVLLHWRKRPITGASLVK